MTREEVRVQKIMAKIAALGPMLPGSISKQWNVCGTPGCHCKDRVNPIKHGPYNQISFTVGGQSSTMFIKKADLPEVGRRLKCYRQFKSLKTELVLAHIALARRHGFGKMASCKR